MSVKLAGSLAIAVVLSTATLAWSQSGPVFPLQKQTPAPYGDGYVGRKPFDILGLTTGMPMDKAKPIVERLYGEQRRKVKPNTDAFPFNNEEFVVYFGPEDKFDPNKAEDTLYVMASSPVVGSEVIFIRRYIRFPNDKPANLEETVKALKAKYGPPGSEYASDKMLDLNYSTSNGELTPKHRDFCLGARNLVGFDAAKDRENIDIVAAAQHGNAEGCTIAASVQLVYATAAGTTNKKAVAAMFVTAFDVKRTWTGVELDDKEIDRLKGLAKTTPGQGAPKKL